VLVTNCCTQFITARQNAVATTPRNKADPHTAKGGKLNGSLAIGIATRLSRAVTAIWTIVRLTASALGANLLILITCKALAKAQIKASISPGPIVICKPFLSESSINPNKERTIPRIPPSVGFCLSNGIASIATNGTYMPEMNPAWLDVVYCSETV